MEDPGRIFVSQGGLEAVLNARQSGKVRYIGFTGHKSPDIHLEMLRVADEHRFRFDAVQVPLNVMDAHYLSFGKKVLPVLVKNKIGVLGMLATKYSPLACWKPMLIWVGGWCQERKASTTPAILT